jgi:hypothetical protein
MFIGSGCMDCIERSVTELDMELKIVDGHKSHCLDESPQKAYLGKVPIFSD